MELIYALVGLAIICGLFLLLRAVMLWYWRINDVIEQLEGINSKLERLLDRGQ